MSYSDHPARRAVPDDGTASRYALDLIERLLKTFAQAFLGTLVAANWFSVDQIRHLSTLQAAGVAGIAAVLSVVTSLISKFVNRPDSASLAPGV